MTDWTSVITLLNLIIMLGTALGVIWVFRSSKMRSEQEISERVRQALHEENELLQSRLKRVEGDYSHLNDLLLLVIDMLKKTHNITLEIDGNIIKFRGGDGSVQISRLESEAPK